MDESNIFVGDSPIGWPSGEQPGGIVYMYEKSNAGEWVESARMTAKDSKVGDNFGRSIFLDGKTLVIGAPGLNQAYVYNKNASGEWQDAGVLAPTKILEDAEFGGAFARGGFRANTIAMVGEKILVTSYSSSHSAGAVHVFQKTGMEWKQEAILEPYNYAGKDGYGWSIAGYDNGVVVGAPLGGKRSGALHVFNFDLEEGQWSAGEPIKLQGLGEEFVDAKGTLGQAIGIGDGKLFATVPGFNGTGAVFILEQVDGVWVYKDRLDVNADKDQSQWTRGFGAGLAVHGSHVLVGARGSKVFHFDLSGESVMTKELNPKDERSTPGFGVGLVTDGNVAVIGSPRSDYETGLATVYQLDAASGEWTPGTSLLSESGFLTSIKGEKVECEGGSADQFDCENVDLLAFMSAEELTSERGVRMTDIWGWEDSETGKEWVLQARTNGTAFVDISNPSNPIYVGQLMKTETSPGSTWRDVKVYKDHAYVVADGAKEHGIQIFDLRQLRDVDPADMPVNFEMTAHYTGVHSTHNIVINEESGYAFAVGNRAGGETCGGQLHIISLENPIAPVYEGCFTHEGAGGTHDAQCVNYIGPDPKYQGKEVCLNSNGGSFIIADVTDKKNTTTISQTFYPKTAYTHQGWLSEDHKYFFMNDELDEMNNLVENTRTLIWDVQELEDPQLVNEFLLSSKASDHNLYIRDNFMYQSNYQAGLRILDISDPENPVEAGHFDTVPYGVDQAGFGGSWSNYPYFKSGVIAVSSRSEGLFLLKKKEIAG